MNIIYVMIKFVKSIIRSTLGIRNDVTLNKDSIYRAYCLKWQKLIYHKEYSTDDLIGVMKSLGMKKNSCVFVHCSWNSLYNYVGNPKEFIDAILAVIGDGGTLAMPAFPLEREKMLKGEKVFNLKKSITGGGFLAETFRRYPNVRRSINK